MNNADAETLPRRVRSQTKQKRSTQLISTRCFSIISIELGNNRAVGYERRVRVTIYMPHDVRTDNPACMRADASDQLTEIKLDKV